ncbi:MAG: hypothetical protein U0350_33445 [Caldilineaceae bacterium]
MERIINDVTKNPYIFVISDHRITRQRPPAAPLLRRHGRPIPQGFALAPTYAVPWTLRRRLPDFVMTDGDQKIPITVWYPALNPNQAKELDYSITPGITSVPDVPAAEHILKGRVAPECKARCAFYGPYP